MNLPSNLTGAAKVPARSVRRRIVNEVFMLVSGDGCKLCGFVRGDDPETLSMW